MAVEPVKISLLTEAVSINPTDFAVSDVYIGGVWVTRKVQWQRLLELLGGFSALRTTAAIASGELIIPYGYNWLVVSAESGTADTITTLTNGEGVAGNPIVLLTAASGHTLTYGAYTITDNSTLWIGFNGSAWVVVNEYKAVDLYKNLWIGGWQPTLTSGCGANAQIEMGTNKNVYDYLPFDASTVEYAYANVVMPDDYDGGAITAEFYWTHPATTTNFKISWGLQGISITNDETLDVTQGTAVYTNDEGGTTSDLYISPATAAITIAGTPAAGKLVQFRASRKADDATNDTLAVDAYLLGVMITYGVN